MKKASQWVVLLTTLTISATTSAFAQNDPKTPDVSTFNSTPDSKVAIGIRNKGYCEIIPMKFQFGKIIASVYSSFGREECPPDAWKAMDVNAIKKQFNVRKVIMNGPRYWTMDKIIAKGETSQGESVKIGGYDFTKRAEILLSPLGLKPTPYKEREIQRETKYIFDAGKPIYELISVDGRIYVMQSYAQIVDPKLTANDLPTLSSRLKLPKGWKYQTVIPDKNVELSADGIAHLIQDDLKNSYQRIESGDTAPSISSANGVN